MPNLNLATAIPPLLVAVLLALSFHKMTAGKPEAPPPPNTAAYREVNGGAAAQPTEQPAANTQTHS